MIFGNSKVTSVEGYAEYLKQWKDAITNAHRIAAEKAGQCAARGRDEYHRKARSSELYLGDRVLVKNLFERGGPGKLRSFWEEKIYVVVHAKDPQAAVYEVGPEDQDGRTKVLHRNRLLPCPFLPHAEKQSLVRMGHTKTAVKVEKQNRYCQNRPSQPVPKSMLPTMRNSCQHLHQTSWNKLDIVLRTR